MQQHVNRRLAAGSKIGSGALKKSNQMAPGDPVLRARDNQLKAIDRPSAGTNNGSALEPIN